MCVNELKKCNESLLYCTGIYCYKEKYFSYPNNYFMYCYLELIRKLFIMSQIITASIILTLITKKIFELYKYNNDIESLKIENRK